MRKGFTLLEVLLAAVILGAGLMAIVVSMMQAQQMMIASTYLQTAQEVMDFGDMAYPLSDVQDPDKDLDVRETKATELWEKFAGDTRLTSEQYDKYRTYTWEREALNRNDEDEVKRLGNLYTVKITVRWGDRRRGNGEEESIVTFWRKPE